VGAKIPEGRAEKTEDKDIAVPLDKLIEAERVKVVLLVRDTDWKNNDELNKAVDEVLGKIKEAVKSGKILKELIPLK